MLVRVLGPAALEQDDIAVPVPGGRQQRLLCLLASRAGTTVPVDVLVDGLWGEDLPVDPAGSLHSQVFRLRR
ncbi:MAG TPA: helix-turn-helix domain-containing protein, partial [Pseudonocardia sp.]|nr:helix-turn-helix domain-containing protein [Pseudonocardia sp.]